MISGHHSHHCTYHHGDTLRCFLEENSFLWSPMGSMGLAQGPASLRFSCASGRVCTACFFGWTRRQALCHSRLSSEGKPLPCCLYFVTSCCPSKSESMRARHEIMKKTRERDQTCPPPPLEGAHNNFPKELQGARDRPWDRARIPRGSIIPHPVKVHARMAP